MRDYYTGRQNNGYYYYYYDYLQTVSNTIWTRQEHSR